MIHKPIYRYDYKLNKWALKSLTFTGLTSECAESFLQCHGAFIATNKYVPAGSMPCNCIGGCRQADMFLQSNKKKLPAGVYCQIKSSNKYMGGNYG